MKNRLFKVAIAIVFMWAATLTGCKQDNEVTPTLSPLATKVVKVEFFGYYVILQLNDSTPKNMMLGLKKVGSIQYSGLDKVRVRAEVYNVSDTALRVDSLAKITIIINNDTVRRVVSKGVKHAFIDELY